MTKKLYLIRHATAEDGGNSSMLRDFDRELNSKGIMESARMGAHLYEESIGIDLIVSSPALRTISTAKIFAERLKMESDDIVLDESLYGGGPRAYLALLNSLKESYNSVAIVGHNPDISFFAEYLTRDDTGGSMSKGSVICLENNDSNWAEMSSKMMSLSFRITVEDINEK
ncbi:phosphohistidine phosphatase [Spirosomataceae bacterium TFI 002]|nr:phosphohistidine phosphatase [Spirosomataceae bacterium TFI 002]